MLYSTSFLNAREINNVENVHKFIPKSETNKFPFFLAQTSSKIMCLQVVCFENTPLGVILVP